MKKPYLIGEGPVLAGVERVSVDNLSPDLARQAAYFLIAADRYDETWSILQRVRVHGVPAVYLKPVVLLCGSEEPASELLQAADQRLYAAAADHAELERLVGALHSINHWIEALGQGDGAVDADPSFRMLRYMASRQGEFAPLATTRSPAGYLYPPLEAFLGERRAGESALQVLEFLETQHLIAGRFVTKAHFCGHCGSAFLNFKETCADCGSEDIEADELLHHFRCGYTGERADFKGREGLVCPKCDRALRHIGVDYDKPSVVYRCNSCNRRFQSPMVASTCFHCGRSAEPEQQVLRQIKAYETTAIGNNAALHGMEHLFMRVLDVELGLWSYEALKQFTQVEQARIERYKISTSSVAVVYFENLSDLYVRLGRRAGEVFGELTQVFQSVLRRSDVIAAHSESVFILVLTETNAEQAQRALGRLEQGIIDLLASNLGYDPRLSVTAHAITADLDLDVVLEALVARHA